MKAILAGHYSSQAIFTTIKGKEQQGSGTNIAILGNSSPFFDVKFLNEWISGDAYNFNQWNKVYIKSYQKLKQDQEKVKI